MSESPRPNAKSQVSVLTLLHEGLTPSVVAERFGVSRRYVHYLHTRFKAGGLEALEPGSPRPKSNPRTLTHELRSEITRLRTDLLAAGLAAAAASIAWHLGEAKLHVPVLSTIWRNLRAAGLVTPTPSKRPKAYITRFEAVQPNETWQSDFTHWRLKDGTDAPIINWLDDHPRLLLHCTVYKAVTGKIVTDTLNQSRNEYGTPFLTLTDNGIVYTGRFVKDKNGFEYFLSELDTVKKNGSPDHPQTQGKIERFHQTLKELQHQLDEVHVVYNTQRPYKALEMRAPQNSYEATSKQHLKLQKTKSTIESAMTALIRLENSPCEGRARCIMLASELRANSKKSMSLSITTKFQWWKRRLGRFSLSTRLNLREIIGPTFWWTKKLSDQENQIQESDICPATCKTYVPTHHRVRCEVTIHTLLSLAPIFR